MEKAYFKNIRSEIIPLLNQAKDEVVIAMAWFTSNELFQALLDCRSRDVKVEVVILDNAINFMYYAPDFNILIKKGGIYMAAIHLNDTNFKETIANGVTLVDFFATWCGPCKMLSPTIEDIAAESDGSFGVCKVDIDEAPDIAMSFGIMSVPTLIVFKNGAEAARMIGVQPKSAILDTVKKLVG